MMLTFEQQILATFIGYTLGQLIIYGIERMVKKDK